LADPGHRREIRWIDYYENSGYEISHYVNEINKRKQQHGFTFGEHFFPHDVTNNQLNNGKSVFDTLISLGSRQPEFADIEAQCVRLSRNVARSSSHSCDSCAGISGPAHTAPIDSDCRAFGASH